MTNGYNVLFLVDSNDATAVIEALTAADFEVSATSYDSEYTVTHQSDIDD